MLGEHSMRRYGDAPASLSTLRGTMDSPMPPAELALDELEVNGAASWVDDLIDSLGASSRHIALFAAWAATCGSLFFSEVLGWRPCALCWYQRILMYPLALLLAIGIVRRDHGLHAYVLPFSIAGIGVSLYHYLLIKTDWFPPPACAVDVPCTVDYLNWFGFVNIPFLALTAFLIITCMLLTFGWLQPLTATAGDDADATEDRSDTQLPVRLTMANLAVVMIIVGVILAFMIGSTFI
jgi:disulfide bond formation protein DsbB